MICESERILNNAQCDVDRRLVLLFNLHKPQPGIILTSIILNKSSILLCYNSSFKTCELKSRKSTNGSDTLKWSRLRWTVSRLKIVRNKDTQVGWPTRVTRVGRPNLTISTIRKNCEKCCSTPTSFEIISSKANYPTFNTVKD